MDFQQTRRKNERNQVKMYYIDTEPRSRYSDSSNQQRCQDHLLTPPTSQVLAEDSSPTPSSDHSAFTTSFHSTVNQIQHQQTSQISAPFNKNYQSHLEIPLNIAAFRHSSSSIDHRTLNLIRFEQNHHLLNSIDSRRIGSTFGSKYHSSCLRNSSNISNSRSYKQSVVAKRYNPELSHLGSRKRSSIHFAVATQSPRSVSFQRHLSTPVPQPPRPPTRRLTNQETRLNKLDQEMARPPTQVVTNNEMSPSTATSNLQQINLQQLEQQQGTGSLDNIQMIVDEENNSLAPAPVLSCDQYIFATTDEPFEVSTIKPAERRNITSNARKSQAPSYADKNNRISNDYNNHMMDRKSSGNETSLSGNFLSGVEQVVRFDDLNPTLQQLKCIDHSDCSRKPTRGADQSALPEPREQGFTGHYNAGLLYNLRK